MLREVGHLVMVVRDLAACRATYGSELGLAELGHGTGADGRNVSMFGVGPSVLELWESEAAPDGGPPSDQAACPSVNHFALLVDSVDEAYAVLRERDIRLLGEPSATAIGHRNMQRALLAFEDPHGFHVQISEIIDPRSHLEGRKAAKHRMSNASYGSPGMFRGIDHISTYCTDFRASRAFYHEQLGLEEFFHSTTREPGQAVEAGFEQSAFAVGGTDIELATSAKGRAVGPGTVRQLGFWTDDVDQAYQVLQGRDMALDGPPSEWIPLPHVKGRAFTLHDPDGLPIQIAQQL